RPPASSAGRFPSVPLANVRDSNRRRRISRRPWDKETPAPKAVRLEPAKIGRKLPRKSPALHANEWRYFASCSIRQLNVDDVFPSNHLFVQVACAPISVFGWNHGSCLGNFLVLLDG